MRSALFWVLGGGCPQPVRKIVNLVKAVEDDAVFGISIEQTDVLGPPVEVQAGKRLSVVVVYEDTAVRCKRLFGPLCGEA